MRFLLGLGALVAALVTWPVLYDIAHVLLWPAGLCFWLWTQGNPDAAQRLYDRLGL